MISPDTAYMALIGVLVLGGFGYTFYIEREFKYDMKDTAKKADVERGQDRLEERIDTLYEHLLNKPMPLPKRLAEGPPSGH